MLLGAMTMDDGACQVIADCQEDFRSAYPDTHGLCGACRILACVKLFPRTLSDPNGGGKRFLSKPMVFLGQLHDNPYMDI